MKVPSFRRLPLFWKLLVPYVGLLAIVGTVGGFLITRDLSSRARAAVNAELLQASLQAKASLHEDELYLLESANLAANLNGMAQAVRSRNANVIAGSLQSTLALKSRLSLIVAAAHDGKGLVEFTRSEAGAAPVKQTPFDWSNVGPVSSALADRDGGSWAGIMMSAGEQLFAIATPICSGKTSCDAVGVAIVGLPLDALAQKAARSIDASGLGIAVFDERSKLLATSGEAPGRSLPPSAGRAVVRRTEHVGKKEIQSIYAPFEIQGRRVGTVAISVPAGPAFASARATAMRFVLILLAALAGIVAVGAFLSRVILAQTRPLMATNRALGEGDLSARTPVVTDDEFGQLARGLNQMADQLQASYVTLESRVQERTDEIRRLLNERTEFFASLSHELRTPIALIISHAEMLIDPDFPRAPRAVEERGRVMLDSGRQVLAAVNEILDLARLESGSVRVEIRDVDIEGVVHELAATFRALTGRAGLRLDLDIPGGLPPVLADASRLREILVNLVDNAVKYTPSGGSISLGAAQSGDRIAIVVADTGVGIPEDAAERIFEPFFRVPGTTTQRGESSSGLGLAFVKRLVEAQSGRISLRSSPGEGSTFEIELPVSDGPRGRRIKTSGGRSARQRRAGVRQVQARARAS